MTSIGIGALGEPALAHVLKGALGSTLAHGVAVAIAAIVAFADHRLRAARSPARWCRSSTRSTAPRRSRGASRGRCRPSASLFHPFIVALTAVAERILRAARRRHGRGERRGGSPDELKRLIAESQAGGHIDPGEAGMLTGVFHLHEQEARQVMTPIPAVVTVDISPGRRDGAAALHLQRPHAPAS